MAKKYVVWFEGVDKNDLELVGGKGANLGEMVSTGIPVPGGFIVTAHAYFTFLQQSKLKPRLEALLRDVDVHDPQALDRTAKALKREILQKPVPAEIAEEIVRFYAELSFHDYPGYQKNHKLTTRLKKLLHLPLVAVRSSATAEDLPNASFAGQQATFLNIQGEANVVAKVKECWASLFEPRAIFYREEQKFDHFKVGIAVPVQKMIQATVSGVMFTVDPISQDKKKIVIEAIYGLGEYIVQGVVTPDHYEVDKKSLHIISKSVAAQEKKLVLNSRGKGVENRTLTAKEAKTQKLSDRQILALAKLGAKLEKHYYFPQDVEWAIEDGAVYILQTRPVTTLGRKDTTIPSTSPSPFAKLEVIARGSPASPGIATGSVKIIRTAKEIYKVKTGDVLVASETNPDYVPAMKKAVAIVTEHGGRTSHAAIVSRELGIPAVVGAEKVTEKLKDGSVITVDGAKGEIYKGALPVQSPTPNFKREKYGNQILKTATRVYVNLAEPSRAAEIAKRHVDGIGLLRAEFMVAHIGHHPRQLIKEKKGQFFTDKLADQLYKFCSAFAPRPVVYRATDFKTNEYRNLIGGKEFEPQESNPMLGYRGAYRYIADPEVFELELSAIKTIRHKKKLNNLWLMIPFVRTPEELLKVKKIVTASGLSRSPSFKLWMMVELPINVILLDDFIDVGIDGVSIGSNDLTMLIMGTDRDNSEVSSLFDERNPAVTWALEKVIKTCHKRGVTSSICGQAPSDYPELVEKMVEWGVTSVSVNPDAIERVRETVYEAEKKLVTRK